MKRGLFLLIFILTLALALPTAFAQEADGAWEMLRLLHAEKGQIAYSPLSLAFTAAMGAEGASGETRQGLLQAAGLDEDALSALPGLLDTLDDMGVKCANALFAPAEVTLLDEYLAVMRGDYAAERFDAPLPELNAKVNAWVKDKTDGLIDSLLSSPPDPNTRLLLLNALALKADWVAPFDGAGKITFAAPTGDVRVSAMRRTDAFQYAEKDGAQAIRLPYRQEGLSMTVVLPGAEQGLDGLLDSLCADGAFWEENWQTAQIDLTMPKFSLESSHSLAAPLQKLGAQTAFGKAADFSGITGEDDIMIGGVVQKVRMDVDEKGTTAAAATAMTFLAKGMVMRPELTITLDRPFLALITCEEGGPVLFAACVENPNAK